MEFAKELSSALAKNRMGDEWSLRGGQEAGVANWSGEDIICDYYDYGLLLICEGVPCQAVANLRVDGFERMLMYEEYVCANNCTLNMTIWDYSCPGGTGNADPADPATGGSSESGNEAIGDFWPYPHARGSGLGTGCELLTPACNLTTPSESQRAQVAQVLALLPAWARAVLEHIVLDPDTTRFQVWTTEIVDTTSVGCPPPNGCLVRADVHGAISDASNPPAGVFNPSALLHLHVSAFGEQLRSVLCHEAVHLYHKIPEGEELTNPLFAQYLRECRADAAT